MPESHEVTFKERLVETPGRHGLDIIVISVEALTSCDDLEPTKEQVETVGVGRPVGIGMGVKRPLLQGVTCHKEKIALKLPSGPLTQDTLILWRQIEVDLGAPSLSCEDPARLPKRDLRDRVDKQRAFHLLSSLASLPFVRTSRNHVAYDLFDHLHDVFVIVDESHLGIEACILVEMTGRVVWLGAEDGTDLKDSFEDPHHHLLVKLRTLGEIGALAEVIEGEGIGASFACTPR